MKSPPPCGIILWGWYLKRSKAPKKHPADFWLVGFVFAAVTLSSFKHKTNGQYAVRANKGLFTKPSIHWLMKPQEYFSLCFNP